MGAGGKLVHSFHTEEYSALGRMVIFSRMVPLFISYHWVVFRHCAVSFPGSSPFQIRTCSRYRD